MSDSTKSQGKERIDAVELTHIQQSNHGTPESIKDSNSTSLLLWAGLATLLLLVITVIFLLPKAVDNSISSHELNENVLPKAENIEKGSTDQSKQDERQEARQLVKTEPQEEQGQARIETEALLAKLIDIEKKLQNHAVDKWAPEEYAQAIEKGRTGDEYYRQRKYPQAIEHFQNAIAGLEVLEQRIKPVLEQALLGGEQALKQADQETATQQFELAIAIDSGDIRAKQGLQRASTIKDLFEIMQRASRFESHGQLQQALSTYREAMVLDPLSEEAKSSFARVDSKLKQQAFDQAIATAYKALQKGQYTDAQAAFNAAKTIRPDSDKPQIGLNKVADAVRQEKIESLLYEANHFAELQEWQRAATSYEKVLQLEKHHMLAQQGLEESQAKANILKELKVALDSSDQLYKDEVLEKAEDLLRAIAGLEHPGSIIEGYYQQLGQLVRVATTPISITLESDRNTQVTIYKIARLGTFGKHQLQLRPGPYTIVGTRTGYRDVRLNIQVSPKINNSTILVVCEEPI
jgi:tetratricopeptide (TPR) repeat protein